MTLHSHALSNYNDSMTLLESQPSSNSLPTVAATPSTDRGILVWENFFLADDVPLPRGFLDIDDVIAAREKNPKQRALIQNARRELAKNLPTAKMGIAALRLSRGLSQKQLGKAIGASQPHIARIENGRDNILLATANKLAVALGVSLEEISRATGCAKSKL